MKFTRRPEGEELHTVAGDGCVLIKVRANDTESLENFLTAIRIQRNAQKRKPLRLPKAILRVPYSIRRLSPALFMA
nr:Lrp/AsnC ligand binding domain-containing protein [Silvania confinis]